MTPRSSHPIGLTGDVREAIRLAFGIVVPDDQVGRLSALVHDAVRRRLTTEAAFARDLVMPGPLQRWAASKVTVDESYFFRSPAHLEALRTVVVPDFLARNPVPRVFRALSAGCSRGQEAHTLAMVLRLALPPEYGIEVLGVDVNPVVLETARSGLYSEWSIRNPVEPAYQRWLRSERGHVRVADEIRSLVRFEERNLAHDDAAWQTGHFDLVFFRNVAIYLDPPTYRAIVARIADGLVEGGFLFLAEAETLRGISDAFLSRFEAEAFFHQRLSGPVPPVPPAPEFGGRWDEAIASTTQRITDLTRPPTRTPPPVPAARSVVPNDRHSVDRLVREERFSELAELDTEGASALDAVASAVGMLNSGRPEDAWACGMRVLSRSPRCPEAHHLLALCKGSDPSSAVHDVAALHADPSFAMARLHMGLALLRSGRRDHAKPELARAIAALPGEADFRIALFGGGLDRETLMSLAKSALGACGRGL